MVIFYTTKRGGTFLVSKNDIDKKTLKRKFKHLVILSQEICTLKTIDTIFGYWDYNDSKIGINPSGKCWVSSIDNEKLIYMSKEEIKSFINN